MELDSKRFIQSLLDFREQCERVEKHNGIVNHKFVKRDAQWILEEMGIKGRIVGGNFFSTPNPFIVHTDTGKASEGVKPTYNLVIPLTEKEDHATVMFDQTYNGDAAHFMVGAAYKYWPDPVYNLRKENYDDVEGLSEMETFDYFNFLTHLPWETVKNLSVNNVAQWKIGQAIVFESKHLHCGANFKGRKEGLTLLIAS